MTSEDRIEALAKKLSDLMEANLEYEETHKDAGDSYAHLPREASLKDGLNKLDDYLLFNQDIDLGGLGLDKVMDLALENFSMESSSHDAEPWKDVFVLGEYPITEIESQIDKATLTGLDPDATDEEWAAAKEQSGIAFRGDLAYQLSDAIWYAIIKKEDLMEAITSHPDYEPAAPSGPQF